MGPLGEPQPDELQFDQAEYDEDSAPGPVCGLCKQAIDDAYYETNGMLFCSRCREAVGDAMTGGSGLKRFLKAGVFGLVAAVAGFAIYFAIMKATGYEIGLISILVGLMVGKAVQKGSDNRGGWVYQLLAMFLVYTAIAASYGATIIPDLIAKAGQEQAAEDAPEKKAADGKEAKPAAEPKPSLVGVLGALAILVVLVVGFLYALPVLVGIQAPMGLLIIGFALWEAWKINRKASIVFNGPFHVGDGDGGMVHA